MSDCRKTTKRIWLLLGLVLMLVTGTTGCKGEADNKETGFFIYYPDKEYNKVMAVEYTPASSDAEMIVEECIEKLSIQPKNVELRSAIPAEVRLLSIDVKENLIYLDFSAEYYNIDNLEEVLRRAAIVRTLNQIEGIDGVSFAVEGIGLEDAKSQPLGIMTADMFIDNAGNEINSYERTKLTLYYSNEAGDKLLKTAEMVVYNTNISMEKLVTEHIISGPLSSRVIPVVSKDVEIISVNTKDGVCYVNLSKEFLNKQGALSDELVIYSFVNSLTELPNINKVQFMIEGESDVDYGNHSNLNELFERNLEIVEN